MVEFCRRSNWGPTSQQASNVVPQAPEQGQSKPLQQPNKPQPTVQNKGKSVVNEPSNQGRRLYVLEGAEMVDGEVQE